MPDKPRSAQHASAGDFHLETLYVAGHWECEVRRVKTKERVFNDSTDSLETAKAKAEMAVRHAGYKGPVDWKDIGPYLGSK